MVDLDLWANCIASEFFPPEGSNVNPEYQWPFPTKLPARKPSDQIPDTRDRGNTEEAPF